MNYYPYSPHTSPPWTIGSIGSSGPVYTILIIGMVLFMASNIMPNLLPAPDRVFHVAPMLLQWGFLMIILALLAQMTGLMPGIPQVHLTYVHMVVAALLFALIWNQIASDLPPPPPEPRQSSSSSSSSSSSRDREKEKERSKLKDESPAPSASGSAWDELRAHPSAFLTTRLNRAAMWPFPMGKADRKGTELWWESGTPAHVGHFNRPVEPAAPTSSSEKPRDKDKEKAEDQETAKLEEKAKEEAKLKEKEREREKAKEAEKEKLKALEKEKERVAKEAAVASKTSKSGIAPSSSAPVPPANPSEADRQRQRLWRTKALVMIIGVSLVNKSLGFLLLLFFCLQMVSQELNQTTSSSDGRPAVPTQSFPSQSGELDADRANLARLAAMKEAEKAKAAHAPTTSSEASSSSRLGKPSSEPGGKSHGKDKEKDREKEKLAQMQAIKEAQKAKEAAAGGKSSSASPPSSSSSSSSQDRSRSSKSDAITSDAVREAAGSKTVTKVDNAGTGPPIPPGIGMHYIFATAAGGALDVGGGPAFIPSEGMAHPLMTTTNQGWAN